VVSEERANSEDYNTGKRAEFAYDFAGFAVRVVRGKKGKEGSG
jgi:hypothetical protein